MSDACAGDAGREHFAPVRLTWYPHNLGWHWPGLERRTVKKDPRNSQLKEYLTNRERSGLISRQETVSMLPPLFLDVQPHHDVVDLCAAPGSKTAQIVEIMNFPRSDTLPAPPSGLVLANELQWKRANMLAHQVQRLGSPCAAVVNMDAQFFPDLWQKDASGEFSLVKFDRVLCDVPCSGDGTMRKTPYIWRSWTIRDGLALHFRQLGILLRGLDLLKVGGRLVYSTCSLNPVEDEAVVAAALHRHGSAVVLAAPPDLPGLKAAECLDTWVIQNPGGTEFFTSYSDVPQELKQCKCKLLPTMFPPTGEGSAEIRASVRKNCRRLLPHLMDTGGFFVAAFEKVAEFKPSAKARREDRNQQIRKQQQGIAEASASAGGTASPGEPAVAAAGGGNGAEARERAAPATELQTGPPEVEGTSVSGGAQACGAPTMPSGLRRLQKEYVPLKNYPAMWEEIRDYYGFDEASAQCLVRRSENDQRVFLISRGLERFMSAETKLPTRMVLCGVVALERASSCHVRACPWRLTQQGIAAVSALGLRRRLSASKDFLISLLREKEMSLEDVRAAASRGDIRGLEQLGGDAGGELCPGSLAVVFDSGSEGPCGAVSVAANLAEDMLELAVGCATETAAILEELQGQPPVDQILQAPPEIVGDGGAAADDEEGAFGPDPESAEDLTDGLGTSG